MTFPLARCLPPRMARPRGFDLPPVRLGEVERLLDFLLRMSGSISHSVDSIQRPVALCQQLSKWSHEGSGRSLSPNVAGASRQPSPPNAGSRATAKWRLSGRSQRRLRAPRKAAAS